jgi:hypothetical protein
MMAKPIEELIANIETESQFKNFSFRRWQSSLQKIIPKPDYKQRKWYARLFVPLDKYISVIEIAHAPHVERRTLE